MTPKINPCMMYYCKILFSSGLFFPPNWISGSY